MTRVYIVFAKDNDEYAGGIEKVFGTFEAAMAFKETCQHPDWHTVMEWEVEE